MCTFVHLQRQAQGVFGKNGLQMGQCRRQYGVSRFLFDSVAAPLLDAQVHVDEGPVGLAVGHGEMRGRPGHHPGAIEREDRLVRLVAQGYQGGQQGLAQAGHVGVGGDVGRVLDVEVRHVWLAGGEDLAV